MTNLTLFYVAFNLEDEDDKPIEPAEAPAADLEASLGARLEQPPDDYTFISLLCLSVPFCPTVRVGEDIVCTPTPYNSLINALQKLLQCVDTKNEGPSLLKAFVQLRGYPTDERNAMSAFLLGMTGESPITGPSDTYYLPPTTTILSTAYDLTE